MTANEVFQQLVQKLYSSHLHFLLTETPFSAQILIRKKFLNDRTIPSSSASILQSEENCNNQILELQKKVQDSSEIVDILQKKLGETEAKALKSYEEKKIEIETLKNSLKNSNLLTKNLKRDLEIEKKVVKENKMLIQKLEQKNENLTLNYKNIKTEMDRVKNENKKLSKKNNQTSRPKSKTSEQQKSCHEEDSNQNLPPSKSSQSCLSSTKSRDQSPTPGTADSSPTSPATPPRACPSTTPPCAPPSATSGSTAAFACEGMCSHSPQCTTRQPRQPPPDKCTVLVHYGSKYHELMISQKGVPHQLGETHEYCMRIDYENYGCEECKWFKRWGELHGYPDINPWTFKEHRQPLTYL